MEMKINTIYSCVRTEIEELDRWNWEQTRWELVIKTLTRRIKSLDIDLTIIGQDTHRHYLIILEAFNAKDISKPLNQMNSQLFLLMVANPELNIILTVHFYLYSNALPCWPWRGCASQIEPIMGVSKPLALKFPFQVQTHHSKVLPSTTLFIRVLISSHFFLPNCSREEYLEQTTKYSHNAPVKVKVPQLCPALCDPMDYTVHGILQARILEWVAIPFSRGSSQARDRTQVSCIAGGFFTSWATTEA